MRQREAMIDINHVASPSIKPIEQRETQGQLQFELCSQHSLAIKLVYVTHTQSEELCWRSGINGRPCSSI